MREYHASRRGRPRCADLPLSPSCCWWWVRWRASMRTTTDRRRGWRRGAGLPLAREEGSFGRNGKATGRPQRAGRHTRGKASQMLAHLGRCQYKGKTVLRIWEAGSAYRPWPRRKAALRPQQNWRYGRGTALDTMTSVKNGK